MQPSHSTSMRPKPQSRACEACRAAKVRCQPGPHDGICKRCCEFKRECVFRTGPRTRRTKAAKDNAELPPPQGPSRTFSIDFSMPAVDEPTASFDELREQHERFIDDLIPSSEEEPEDDLMASAGGPSFNFPDLPTSGSSTSAGSRSVHNLGIKPQFNLDSAEKLLQGFRSMLPCCPCVVLDENADVRSMARDSPFVLLAILAATSCSNSLQGHSLYDEEFRKVLGLKFVSGGERSLELLQGILVYCAWYPFHLRPKHRQAIQYLKMATDIVQELGIDKENMISANSATVLNSDNFAKIRAFIACYYQATLFSNSFLRSADFPYTSCISRCCDLLEQQSNLEQDHVLAWLIRFHHISDEMGSTQRQSRKPGAPSQHHRNMIRIGLETQLREWQSRIPTTLSIKPSIMISSIFNDMYLSAGPLMTGPRARLGDFETSLDPNRLMSSVLIVGAFFDFVLSLSPDEFNRFSNADWGHLIIACILGYRLSLPLELCPEFDSSQARLVFDFSSYLERLCREPEEAGENNASKKTDTFTAFRVVLRSLKAKLNKKIAAAEAKEELTRRARECPMFDGSLDEYITLWDGHGATFPESLPGSTLSSSGVLTEPIMDPLSGMDPAKPIAYDDLWTAMTMGWGGEQTTDFGSGETYHQL